MRPLELVETDALRDELLARCDHGVIAMMWIGEAAPGIIERRTLWRGNPETCIGLSMRLVRDIQDRLRSEEESRDVNRDVPEGGS